MVDILHISEELMLEEGREANSFIRQHPDCEVMREAQCQLIMEGIRRLRDRLLQEERKEKEKMLECVEIRPGRRVILSKDGNSYRTAVEELTADGWRTVRESCGISAHHLAVIGFNSAVAYERSTST